MRRSRQLTACAVGTLVLVSGSSLDATAAAGGSTPPRSAGNGGPHVSAIRDWGVELVESLDQAQPTSEEQAQDLSDAHMFAETHPDDVGYPWIDPASGRLELSAASARGSEVLGAQRSAFATVTRVREVEFSYGELQAIRDEIITLHAEGVRDADLIYGTSEDHRSNRVVIWVKEPSEALFKELAARFGTEAIAVLVDAESFGGSTASRQADGVPYYGGASINGGACSDSFSWTISGTKGDAMLTAAHCKSSGGFITIGTTTIGTVTSGRDENWSATTGTTYYTGQSTYYGDVALIRLYSTLSSAPRIYRGGPTSSTSSPVIGKRTRYSVYNDLVFVGGKASGETGQYQVVDVHADWWYSDDGPNVWVRNITRAGRAAGPPCAADGDSGGSVFVSPVSPSGVTAAGTYSGNWGPTFCNIVFTDIWATYVALPGDIWD